MIHDEPPWSNLIVAELSLPFGWTRQEVKWRHILTEFSRALKHVSEEAVVEIKADIEPLPGLAEKAVQIVAELQLHLDFYLEARKRTHLWYKIIRAKDMYSLKRDCMEEKDKVYEEPASSTIDGLRDPLQKWKDGPLGQPYPASLWAWSESLFPENAKVTESLSEVRSAVLAWSSNP